MSAKPSLDPATAFDAFVALGETRSINGLAKVLQARGYKCARTTLESWRHKYGWNEAAEARIAQEAASIRMQVAAAVNAEPPIELGPLTPAETFESTAQSLQKATSIMAHLVAKGTARFISADVPMDVAEVLQWARAAGDLAKACADLQKVMVGPVGKAAPTIRDANGVLVSGGETQAPAMPAGEGPPGWDELRKIALNPPMSR